MAEFNFIHESLNDSDKELFFGPLKGDEKFISFDDQATFADIVVLAGKFGSKTQARKNGFDKDINPGFEHITIGKNKNRIDIWILNKF